MHFNKFNFYFNLPVYIIGIVGIFYGSRYFLSEHKLYKNFKSKTEVQRTFESVAEIYKKKGLWHQAYTENLFKFHEICANGVVKNVYDGNVQKIALKYRQKQFSNEEAIIKALQEVGTYDSRVRQVDATTSAIMVEVAYKIVTSDPTRYNIYINTISDSPASDYRGLGAKIRAKNLHPFLNERKHKYKFGLTNDFKRLIWWQRQNKTDKYFYPVKTGNFYVKELNTTEEMNRYFKITKDLEIYTEKIHSIPRSGNVIIIKDLKESINYLFYQNSPQTNNEQADRHFTFNYLKIFSQNANQELEKTLENLGYTEFFNKVEAHYKKKKEVEIKYLKHREAKLENFLDKKNLKILK